MEEYLLRRFPVTPELAATVRSLAGPDPRPQRRPSPLHGQHRGRPGGAGGARRARAAGNSATGGALPSRAGGCALDDRAPVRSPRPGRAARAGGGQRGRNGVLRARGGRRRRAGRAWRSSRACTGLARREQFLEAGGAEEWPDGTIAARYAFRHALYREVLYERVPPARRAALHTRVGLRLEAGYGERSSEIAAELAMHFERGRDLERAVRYLDAAGQNAIARNAPREAMPALRAGDRPAPGRSCRGRAEQELTLQIALGSQLMAINGWAAPEVERAYARAHALGARRSADAPQLFPALWGLWLYCWGRGELGRARALGEHLLELAERAGDRTLVLQAHHALWPTLLSMGEIRAQLSTIRSEGTAQYEAGAPAFARTALREPRSRRLRPLLRRVGAEPARAGGPRGRDEPSGDRAGPATGPSLQRGPFALLRRRGAPVSGRAGRRSGTGRGRHRPGPGPRLRPRARVGHARSWAGR